ncbi:FliH/SctL family protein [Chengkuizengella axinellae]|uniref:FliH/SctL family protein n=1 Tax=Chengkuizengella axinellae TaxID=3064388 RepID=A0ABT9IVQ1_9BACL|nr:FliH/SctL family protein [Chengkuizengella sp. 2205SS18-9]MDP5273439.1 FliH/SctL family protein [Chengkuizengella sp. 2205SS18-9]
MSNLIKSTNYISLDHKKKIDSTNIYQNESHHVKEKEETEQNLKHEELENVAERDRILKEAKEKADQQIKKAEEEAAALKVEAKKEIQSWWSKKRDQDEQMLLEIKNKATEQGLQEGTKLAEEQVLQKYNDLINKANLIVETAYKHKEEIIQESEPFLIELSCAIAEKMMHRELHDSNETLIHIISKVLARRNEGGIIKCCVAPEQYQFVIDAKEELILSLDPQAELQIVPDSSLSGFDCVVHSSFGSIDATIDTQLTEIKDKLLEIARKRDEHE